MRFPTQLRSFPLEHSTFFLVLLEPLIGQHHGALALSQGGSCKVQWGDSSPWWGF